MSDRIKILYVDDEEMNYRLFEKLFSKKYDVFTAESGEQGLNILEKEKDIQVVISDMAMPAMTGLEFIRTAKPKHSGIKFYILTGYDIDHEIESAISSKLILNCFMKPFNYLDIDEAIQKAVE